jgi:7-keto-8-aminopelargonate synthetase-like enzyme
LLVNRARSFIFSTAPVPAAAAAATAGIQQAKSAEGNVRRKSLWQLVERLNSKLKTKNSKFRSAIIPFIIGDEAKTVELTSALRGQNIFIPAIRFPTVARGAARLRVTLTAAHTQEDVEALAQTLGNLKFSTLNLKSP